VQRLQLEQLQSFPSTAEVARGTNAIGWWEDEMPVWRDGDGINPAAERDAAIVPAGATHPNFRLYSVGTPMGHTDFHARLVAAGDTEHQAVFTGPSWYWNPTLTEARCRQLQPDPRMFDREFGAIPQIGLLSALDFDMVNACFGCSDTIELAGPPSMIIDASSGRGDAFTWAIARWCRTVEGRELLVFALVDGIDGKFAKTMSGDAIVDRLAAVCRAYGVTKVRRCGRGLDVAQEVRTLASNSMSSLTWMLSSERTADLMSRRRPPSARGPTRLSNFAPTSSHVNGWLENPG
jgi:hypothetical protein